MVQQQEVTPLSSETGFRLVANIGSNDIKRFPGGAVQIINRAFFFGILSKRGSTKSA
jgi:hypothetical protein